jgi:hypothetical protein
MKVIPDTWKTGADRKEWLISKGDIVWLVEIGTKHKFGTRPFWLKKNNGLYTFYKKGLITISDICIQTEYRIEDTGFLIKGTFSGAEITLIEDEYVSSMLGEDITIRLCFADVDIPSYDDTLIFFKGKIVSARKKNKAVKLSCEPLLSFQNKLIPMRIDEYNEQYNKWTTLPKKSSAEPFPICFGYCYAKCYLVIVETGSYYTVIFAYPTWNNSDELEFYYWDKNNEILKRIITDKYEKIWIQDPGKTLSIRFKPSDIDLEDSSVRYIRPFKVYKYSGVQAGYEEKAIDGKLSMNDTQIPTVSARWIKHDLNWYYVFDFHVKVNSFDKSNESDIYIMIDIYRPDQDTQNCQIQIKGFGQSIITTNTDWGGNSERGLYSVELEYANDTLVVRDHEPFLLAQGVQPEYWEGKEVMSIQLLAKGLTYTTWWLLWEFALKQVMYTLPTDFYVLRDFGKGTLQEALEEILRYAGITDYDIQVDTDLKCDFQMNEFKTVADWLDEFAKQYALHWSCGEGYRIIVRSLFKEPSVYFEVTDSYLIVKDGGVAFEIQNNAFELYSKFIFDYDYDPVQNKPQFSEKITSEAQTDRGMKIQGRSIRDRNTVLKILNFLSEYLAQSRRIVTFTTSYIMIDVDVGDYVRFNTKLFNERNLFLVISKRIVPDGLIEFKALETNLQATAEYVYISEDLNFVEDIKVNKGIQVNNQLQFSENVVVVKEPVSNP